MKPTLPNESTWFQCGVNPVGRCSLALLTSLILIGCTPPKYKTYTLEEYTVQSDIFTGKYLTIEVDPASQINLVDTDSIEADLLRHIPDAASNGYAFVVGAATDPNPVIRSQREFVYSLRFNVETTYWKNRVEPRITARTVVATDETVICYVPESKPSVRALTYFCRNTYGDKLGKKVRLVFPGFSVIDGGFWVIIPRARVVSVLLPIDPYENGGGLVSDEEQYSGPYVVQGIAEKVTWSCEELEQKIEEQAEAKAYRDHLNLGFAREIVERRYAPERALCLASQEDDDGALSVLREAIDEYEEHSDQDVVPYTAVGKYYAVTMLIEIAKGDAAAAANFGAALLHCSRPCWSFQPEYNLAPVDTATTALTTFVSRREGDLRRHWPAFIDSLYGESP